MLTFLYYALMIGVGVFAYRHGQKLLRQGLRDDSGEIAKPPLGPISFVVCAGIACFLGFGLLRALVQGQIECIGKGCRGQVYTLAEQAGQYWGNVFFLAWMVVFLAYALYVTFRIWSRG